MGDYGRSNRNLCKYIEMSLNAHNDTKLNNRKIIGHKAKDTYIINIQN